MARKTNKTSHVLNLLTNGNTEAEEAQAPQAAAKGTASGDAGAAAPPPEGQKTASENKVIVVNETSENEKLSNEIKDRLTAQLEAEAAAKAAEDAARAAQEEAARAEAEAEARSAQEEAARAEAEAAARAAEDAARAAQEGAARAEAEARAEQEEAARAEAEAAARAAEDAARAEAAEDAAGAAQEEAAKAEEPAKVAEPVYRMVNVMEQVLERQDLDKQMEQYGVCTCSRCKADVRALVLTKLPSKYVIVDETASAPIIGYYQGKYRTRIFTEIMKACIKVKDRPRHQI